MRCPPIVFEEIPQFKILKQLSRQRKLKIYLVGGCLRDYFLNQLCFDFDFAVSKDAIKFARLFSKKIKGAFVLLDEEHGCARVAKKMQGSLFTFDFADFRDKTLMGDLAHRDFTINTLCVNLDDLGDQKDLLKILMDPKKGLRDLEAKRIKMVSARSFKDDPLRLMRAFSLRAELNFKIDPKTLTQIRKDKGLLRQSAYERIRDELFKIFSSGRAAENLKSMASLGLLEQIIPQISIMFGVTQGGYHHLDVWPHSLETVLQLEQVFKEFEDDTDVRGYLNETLAADRTRLALLKLAALLHDIGKPDAKRKEGQKTYFYGHERVGRRIVRDIAQFFKLSVRERHALEDMVFWHLRPGYLSNFKSPSAKAIFRYFRDTKDEAISILLLSLADQRSTRGPLTSAYDQRHHEKIIRRLIEEYFDKKKEKPFARLLTGHDLIRKLKLKPSPLFGKILREVEEQQATGKISAKHEALNLAKRIADESTK